MIPLAPPVGYWNKLDACVSRYMWDGKRPRIKRTTLQRCRSHGGLSFPNFRLYAQAFSLRPLSVWFDPDASVSWRAIEEFSGVPLRQCKSRFGPIVTHLLSTWRDVERRSQLVTIWHRHLPIFHNNNLLSGSTPFHCLQWTHNKVNTLGDIYDDSGLKSFQNLKTQYNLPGTSFLMYLRIRSALWAYGVPWNSQPLVHPLRKLILPSEESPSSASVIYLFLLEHSYKPLSITTVWAKDLNEDVHVLFSDQVWGMFKLSSKNPHHQMIHWKLLHRVYLTPMKCFYMNPSSSPKCNLCSQGVLGTFLHFFLGVPLSLTFMDSALTGTIIFIGYWDMFDSVPFFHEWLLGLHLVRPTKMSTVSCSHSSKKIASQPLESSSHNGQTNRGLCICWTLSRWNSTSLIHGSNVKTVNSWHSAFNVVIFSKIFVKIILLLFIYLLILVYFFTRGWDGLGWVLNL